MRHGGSSRDNPRAPFARSAQPRHLTPPKLLLPALPQVNEAAFSYYPRLSAVAEFARAHLKGPLTLADVARLAGLERKYFSAYFHSKVGITFTSWVRLVRVRRAIQLMTERDASIPRLAFASGFRDVRTFERAFKQVIGVSPAVYRASVRPESRRVT